MNAITVNLNPKTVHFLRPDRAQFIKQFIKNNLDASSVTSKKSPNVYKSCPKRVLLVKWKILTNLQKLPKMYWQFGQNNCYHWLWKVAQSVINRPIWSHWMQAKQSKAKVVQEEDASRWIISSTFCEKWISEWKKYEPQKRKTTTTTTKKKKKISERVVDYDFSHKIRGI